MHFLLVCFVASRKMTHGGWCLNQSWKWQCRFCGLLWFQLVVSCRIHLPQHTAHSRQLNFRKEKVYDIFLCAMTARSSERWGNAATVISSQIRLICGYHCSTLALVSGSWWVRASCVGAVWMKMIKPWTKKCWDSPKFRKWPIVLY